MMTKKAGVPSRQGCAGSRLGLGTSEKAQTSLRLGVSGPSRVGGNRHVALVPVDRCDPGLRNEGDAYIGERKLGIILISIYQSHVLIVRQRRTALFLHT